LLSIDSGSGQFGEVFTGKLISHRNNSNAVLGHSLLPMAIKTLRLNHSGDMKELYSEGKQMLTLDHPHIVKLYGLSKKQDKAFLLLEFCPHGAMNTWLRTNK
jgi:serine/threonine protein kinase